MPLRVTDGKRRNSNSRKDKRRNTPEIRRRLGDEGIILLPLIRLEEIKSIWNMEKEQKYFGGNDHEKQIVYIIRNSISLPANS
ncbi:hypothetical protein C5S53_11960 [Methanophagales archaeon]|nr:hypothetical protein C5S53_11960 [Methanophagales archaeon]